MKRVTASEARRNWFRLLDEVAQGEVVVLERHGKRILLRAEDSETVSKSKVPDYRKLLKVPDLEEAHRWGWEWSGPEGELIPKELKPEQES